MKRKKLPQQALLAEIVVRKGGGAIVAKELHTKSLKCSQQSVSAWVVGSWLPKGPMQERIEKVYGIPFGWKKLTKKASAT